MSKFIPSNFRSSGRHSFAVALSAIVFVLASSPWSAAWAGGPVPTLTCNWPSDMEAHGFGAAIDFDPWVRDFNNSDIEVTHPPGLITWLTYAYGFGPNSGFDHIDFSVGIQNEGDYSPATGDDLAVAVRVPAGVWQGFNGETNTASNTLHVSLYRTVSVGNASALEGTDSNIEFEVTLGSRNDCQTVTVDWETAPGTATAGDDYTAASGTLTFGPGEMTKTVSIAVLDDTQVENDETLTLRLSNASFARIADGEATGTVADDDGNALRVSIAPGSKSATRNITPVSKSVTEGAAAVFTLARTGSLADVLTVDVSVTETGAMLKGSPAATVTFDANSAIAELSVETEDDEVVESASIITAALLAGDHYATDTNRASATVTVQDDDAAPSITVMGQILVNENTTVVATLTATDDDTPVADLAWSIVGGVDAAAFSLSKKGVLSFAAAKDFEAPDDADQDGVYEVTVRVTDGANPAVDATLTVQLTNVGEGAPRLSSGRVDGDTLTLTFDKALDGSSVPASNSFSVMGRTLLRDEILREVVHVTYRRRGVSDVSVGGSTVTLTLASAVDAGEAVVVSYTTPTGTNANPLLDALGNAVVGFSDWRVANETPAHVNTPATGKPAVSGTASVGTTLTASVSGIVDTDGLLNATFAWQWIANDGTSDTDIAGATGSTYTLTPAEAGKTIKVRVTFTDDGGTEEALVSEATAEVASVNAAPVGLPAVSGTPQIGGTLSASSAGISDSDGLTNASYAWQWIANDGTSDTDIAGATGSTYTLTSAEAGKTIKVRVTFTDDGGTEETLESAATVAVEAGLTASFEDVPASHDGSSAFRLRLAFSEEVFEGSEPFDKNQAIQDALVVNGGAVTGRRRVDKGEFDEWWFKVAPSGNGAVTVSLPAQTDCAGAGAVCTPDGTALASPVSATVPGPVSQTREVSIAAANSSTTRGVTADSSPVTEGTAAEFTLTRTGSLADALTVNVSVTETGAMLSRTVPETVTFNANSPTAELRVETEDDEVAEPASVVTAAVAAGSGYSMDSGAASASVTVEDDDAAPVVQTAAIVTVPENTTAVATLTATDDDTPVADLAWSIVSGADAAMFTVSAGGNLAFASAKDFEAPDDADTDGDYEVAVRVTDGANAVDAALTVRLADVVGGPGEPPVHTGPISVSVQCVNSAYDFIESTVWDMHFSAPVRALQETGGARPYEMAGQDDTDFTWFAGFSPDARGLDGPRFSSYRFFTTPRVPRPDGLHSAVVSDVNGVVITVPPGGWQDRSGNLNFNTASANALYLAHNWKVSVADASAKEGTDGTIDFEVTLNARDDCKTVTVDWTTADGTATAGEDYAAASGTLTFGPGETSKTIRVALLETVDVDGSETLSVQLGNAAGVTLDDAEAIGTISGEEGANVPATGHPTVTGTARVGETLTASESGIVDDDGLANATFAWQWIANDGTSDADIAGATGAEYTLTSAEEGKTIKVRATFTDDRGTEETVLSDATAAVTTAYTCTAPNLAGRTEVWTGTLTVATAEIGGTEKGHGFNREPSGGGNYGALSDTSFDFGGTSYVITAVVLAIAPSRIPGLVVMLDKSLPDTERDRLRLHVCGDTFDLASVSANANHSNKDKRYWWANPGIDWSSATTVSLALSGTINQSPTGAPAIAGTPQVGQTLTAGPGDIADGNGITNATFAWQWIANDGTSDADIAGATGAEYTLTSAEEGKTIEVRVTFTDDGGTEETLVSDPTAAVTAVLPSVSVEAVSSPVTEGTAASFTLRRTGDTAAALTIAVSVTEEGAVVSATPASSVTFAGGSAEASLSVATEDDGVAEADARVSVSVTAGSGYQVGSGSGSAGVDVYDNDAVAPAPVTTLWTSTLEWQGDYGAGWVNANEEDFSSPGWSEDGDDYRIWYIAYGSSKDELWVRVDPNMRAGGIPAPEELTLQVGHVTVESAGEMAKFARGDIAIVRGIGQSWAVGEQVQVRLTRTTAGETTVTGPGVSVADAQVQEAEGAVLAFRVTLAEAQTSAVSVRYATSDGTATAGTDYEAVSGALRFAPGETSKTVSVPVLNDAHDEGSETLTLTLTSPFGAQIADGTATGTIVNTDPIPKAWIARFGRTVAEQVIDAVEARMRAPRVPGTELSLGGQRVGGSMAPDGTLQTDDVTQAGAGRNLAEWFGNGDDPERRHGLGSQTMTQRDLMLGSSFSFTGGTERTGTYSLWGRGAVTRFEGREDGLSLDGEVTSGMLGADWSRDALMAGLVVSHSLGEGGYRGESGDGGITSSLTGLYPWGRYALSDRVSVWGLAGYGEGTLTLTPESEAPIRTDLDLLMAAAGLRGVLVQAPEAGGLELAVKTDAMGVQTSTAKAEGLEAAQAEVTRLRLGLEGSHPFRFEGGASLTPSVEIGVRHDGGDAETGFGVDIGGGLAWSDSQRGLSAEIRGRGLLSHAADGFRERGFSGSLSWDPTPGTARGLSFSMSQTLGAQAAGGVDALLERGTFAELAANDNADEFERRRLELKLGYGFGSFGGRFTSIPEAGFGMSEGLRDYSLGWRLVRDRRRGDIGSLELALEARRQESANDNTPPEHSAGVRITARW